MTDRFYVDLRVRRLVTSRATILSSAVKNEEYYTDITVSDETEVDVLEKARNHLLNLLDDAIAKAIEAEKKEIEKEQKKAQAQDPVAKAFRDDAAANPGKYKYTIDEEKFRASQRAQTEPDELPEQSTSVAQDAADNPGKYVSEEARVFRDRTAQAVEELKGTYIQPQRLTPNGPVHGGFTVFETGSGEKNGEDQVPLDYPDSTDEGGEDLHPTGEFG